MKKIITLVLAFAFSLNANAALITESFTGDLASDNGRFYISFDVIADTTVTFTSWSYAGGVNAAGDTILDGGFDPQLFVFNSLNTLLQSNDDASSVVSASSSASYDAIISIFLTAGSYNAVLTQYNSDYQSGDLFTGVWSDANTTGFVDATGSTRTSFYAFDISGNNLTNVVGGGFQVIPTTSVPEPSTMALFGLAMMGLFGRRLKK